MRITFSVTFQLCVLTLGSSAGKSQRWNTILGFGNSIARAIGSGLGGNNEVSEMGSESKDKPRISTDDIFSSLNEVWNQKKEDPLVDTDYKDILIFNETELYKKSDGNNEFNDDVISTNETDEEGYWLRIKTIAENLRSVFLSTYGENSQEKIEIIQMIDHMIEIGDKINLAKTIKGSFDHDLLEYLNEKWKNIKQGVPGLNVMLSVDGKVLLLTLAKGLVKQFGKYFHKEALAHTNEQDFVIETMRTSGFKDPEIYEVFKLLDIPTELLEKTSQSDKEVETQGRYIDFGGMFGRGGGYGGGGGHKGGYSMMKKDPLLLLAGVAFATFAAYIIYRLLSSTPAAARGLMLEDSLSLYLSDVPQMMNNFYNWIEDSEKRYSGEEDQSSGIEFIDSVNRLWRSYKEDLGSKSCVKRFLCHHLTNDPFGALRHENSLEQLSLIGLSEIFGAQGSGKAVDSYVSKLFEGESVNCKTEVPTCDDQKFSFIFTPRTESNHNI